MDRALSVLFVSPLFDAADGPRPADRLRDAGFDVRTATPMADEWGALDDVDCVVCQCPASAVEAGLAAVERVHARRPHVAVLAYSAETDGDLAAEATRRGATEYVSEAYLDARGETLAGRIRALSGRVDVATAESRDAVGPIEEQRESQAALERLYRISADSTRSFEEKLEGILEIGRDRLGVSIGFLTRIEDGTQTVVESVGEHPELQAGASCPLSQAYCRQTIESPGLLGVVDAVAEGRGDDPAYERFTLGCYLGGKVLVEDDLYGTLCFADTDPRAEPFTASERTLVELLTEWVGHELERRRSQTELEATREELEKVFERVADGFFAVDDEWRITFVNDRFEELLGRDRENILGESLWEEFPEAINDLFYEEYHEAMRTQEPTTFEEFFEPVDAWFEVNAYPSADGLSVFFRDVTERREYERILSDLLETSQQFMRADTPEDVARIVVDAAETVLGNELTLVRLYDPDTDELVPVAASDETEALMGQRPTYAPGEGPVGEAFESDAPIVYPDLSVVDDGKDRSPIRSALYAPLGDHGALTVGALEPDAFDTADERYVELLATNAAAALTRADRQRELRIYEAMIDTVQDMVYVADEDGQFRLVTDRLAEWLGYAPDELVGGHVSQVLPPEDVERGRRQLRELYENPDEESRVFEAQGIRADGERVPAEIELSAFPAASEFEGSVGAVRDLTDLVSARRNVAAERERFSSLFENLPDPVVEVEFDSADEAVVESVNPAFERVFDVDADNVVGQRVTALEAVPVPEFVSAGEPTWTTELTSNTPTGRRQFLFRGVRYRLEGAHRGFGIYTDVTALKQRERHLQVLNRILRHNLRNDLNVVYGFADRLAGELDDDVKSTYARRIRDTADELAEFSETAKDIERVIGREIATKPVDPVPVVTELVEEYLTAEPDADIETGPLDDVTVSADERLSLAVDQLLENAVEHTTATPRIRVSVTDEPASTWVVIRVSDDGPGIPEEEWDVVVGDRDITPLEHGTGLGLWLVKWLVDAYGGELDYERSDFDGSAVVVRLRKASRDSD